MGGGLALLCLPLPVFGQTAPSETADGWPHQVTAEGASATVYQPQVISWPGQTTLNARAAVAITRPSGGDPVLGTLEFTAQTSTDLATRTVTLTDPRLVASHFPSLDTAQAAQLDAHIRAVLPQVARHSVPLDTVLLSLRDDTKAPDDAPAMNNDPPVIVYSARPASLVVFDGEPVLAPIPHSPLSLAVNTNWDVFFDPAGAGAWFLLNNDSWFTAPKANGPWHPTESLPQALRSLPDEPNLAEARKAIPGRPLAPDAAPTIFVSLKPAEIIVTDGPPAYTAIPGTRIQVVSNSNSSLFRQEDTKQFYYLVSGRWFSAASLEGPWSFATPNLPPDFAQIPPDGPAGHVLSSVPGTAQAQEAVLQAQIPQQATLRRDAATLQVTYVGKPEFKPIPGTNITYAVNTSFEVLDVGGKYYCCHQGAWFVAPAPTGPWALADSVPSEIHHIPPSHPLHNVTYVNVYSTTPEAVTFGFTAGYLSAQISSGVLVYGTGYWYPPVVLPGPVPVYLPYPYTYAGNVTYNAATGAWGRGGAVYGPYGGVAQGGTAYNPATGAWAQGGAVYGPYGGAGAWSAYNPQTGAYAHGSGAWNSGTGWANASFANPTTGRSGSTNQNWNPYSRWGSSTVSGPNQTVNTESGSNARGSAGAFSSSTGAEGVGARGAAGNQGGAVKTQSGNVYAGADGNVYRRTDDGWSKWNDNSWQQVQTPSHETRGSAGSTAGAGTGTGASAPQPAARTGAQPSPSGTGGGGGGFGERFGQGGQGSTAGRFGQGGTGEGFGQNGGAPDQRFGGQRFGGQQFGGQGQGLGQLEQDHQARQFGEMRQRAMAGGGMGGGMGGGGFGERFGGGGMGGGFHRR